MAGLERLEIHSKSYIVRWIMIEQGHTISWSIQPHKKSINFGIFKHPKTSGTPSQFISGASDFDNDPSSLLQVESGHEKSRRTSNTRNDASTALEQLKAKGFILIKWYGKCEADKAFTGTHEVSVDNGGMYGLIFDNTFSKQLSKTATVVLLTYPSNTSPHTTHSHQMNTPSTISSKKIPGLDKEISKSASASTLSDNHEKFNTVARDLKTTTSTFGQGRDISKNNHVGVLSKRRRRKGQGFARRFFSLDFATCTLSYYYSRNSSALRGAIPLSFAAVTTDSERREIIIDSGAEIWHLKASNSRDFDGWRRALALASRNTERINTKPVSSQKSVTGVVRHRLSYDEETREWEQAEVLVSKIAGTRDTLRRLLKDTAISELNPTKKPVETPKFSFPVEEETDYFQLSEVPGKKGFWRRKPSNPCLLQCINGTSTATMSSLPSNSTTSTPSSSYGNSTKINDSLNSSINDHCSILLSDLDETLDKFSKLLAKSKSRREASETLRRTSIGSASTGEFFDAEPGDPSHPQLFLINHRDEEKTNLSDADVADELATDSSSVSSEEDNQNSPRHTRAATLFPIKPKNLDPLPISLHFDRRKSVPPAVIPPPSLIHFLRKNVGKDLSTVSMPVSANEPMSLLQRIAEQFEYAQLLDKAASQNLPKYRLLYVSAFAISNFSIQRCKERALRKPFNPMLGETFELLRTEQEVPGGFRFIAEKVSHRPVRIACQADSAKWCMSHSPAPTNKFWGKSAEIITEGQVRLVLHLKDGSDELYSWNVASAFLRNVVMGEKYIEPVGTVTVINESTGAKATIDFKQKGMFGGRSEDVEVETHGAASGPSLVGTWTTNLRIVEPGKSSGKEIWRVGELVDNPTQKYGFTTFAASLNEITPIEDGKLPISDCRLRPDQRAAELGNLDEAEKIKAGLEEKQRIRRTEMEKRGESWRPRWFVRAEIGDDGEEVWKLKTGKEGYWEERSRGLWTGVTDVFNIENSNGQNRESPALG
ncbi:hypothetical protein K3495_g9168 [Podosphaera aphanis]|nr:hypothetical protein K3495_g9168 [Podosphaera aphanis]